MDYSAQFYNMKNLIFIALAFLLFSSCKTSTKIVEVPVEVIKKEYVYNTKIDSIYIRDSVDRWQKGDTLYITKWHTKLQYINKIDTITRTDSIPKIITITKETEVNHLYWWQKMLMCIGCASLLYIIISKFKTKKQ